MATSPPPAMALADYGDHGISIFDPKPREALIKVRPSFFPPI